MTETNGSETRLLIALRLRVMLVLFGLTMLGLLATAASLRPSPNGLGTHQQLGLPPCTFRVLFHMRCPACGMTTSWSHLVRGELRSALRANVGGTVLGMIVVVAGPCCLITGFRGQPCAGTPPGWLAVLACVGVVLITVVDWMTRLLITNWS